jgi:predicted Zn-dependent protease
MEQYRNVIELERRDFTEARFQLARLYITERKFPEAFREIERMRSVSPTDPNLLSMLAIAYAFHGERAKSIAIMVSLKRRRQREYLRPYILAEDYAALGEKNQSLDWLEKAYTERDDWIAWIKVDPNLDGLRGEARFTALLERVGLDK